MTDGPRDDSEGGPGDGRGDSRADAADEVPDDAPDDASGELLDDLTDDAGNGADGDDDGPSEGSPAPEASDGSPAPAATPAETPPGYGVVWPAGTGPGARRDAGPTEEPAGDPGADATPPVPLAELPDGDGSAGLGTFHPRLAVELRRMLELRGVPHRVVEVDEVRTEVRVPTEVRDTLRTELTVGWDRFLRVLPADDAPDVLAVGDTHPGWWDAPQGAWVDSEGRLHVATLDDDEVADADRSLGPGLAAAGAILCLFAWGTGGSEVLYLAGGSAVLLGLLLPR